MAEKELKRNLKPSRNGPLSVWNGWWRQIVIYSEKGEIGLDIWGCRQRVRFIPKQIMKFFFKGVPYYYKMLFDTWCRPTGHHQQSTAKQPKNFRILFIYFHPKVDVSSSWFRWAPYWIHFLLFLCWPWWNRTI